MHEQANEIKELIQVIMLQRKIKLIDLERDLHFSKITIRKMVKGEIANMKLQNVKLLMKQLEEYTNKGEDHNNNFMDAKSAYSVLVGYIQGMVS